MHLAVKSNVRLRQGDAGCSSPKGAALKLAIWVAVCLLGVPAAQANPIEQVEKKGDILARARLDRGEIELADSVLLTLTIDGWAPLEIEPITTITRSPEWIVTERHEPQTTTLELGRMRWQQSFRLEPLPAKSVALPLPPVRVRARGGEAVVIEWQPFTVKVSTVVAGVALGALKENTPPEQVSPPERFPWPETAGAVGGLLALLVLGWLGWRRSQRPPRPVPELPPAEWAVRELQALAGNLPGPEQGERWHTLLVEVLRKYAGRRFGVNTAELTSAELLVKLDRAGLQGAHQEQLRTILDQCDLAKFARVAWAGTDCQATAALALDFVQQTAAQRQPTPPSSEQPAATSAIA